MKDESKQNNTISTNDQVQPVPYFIHEGIMARMAECNKKLLIALIVAVIALVVNNIVWVVYEGVVHGSDKEIVYEQETDT